MGAVIQFPPPPETPRTFGGLLQIPWSPEVPIALRQPRAPGTRSQTPANATQQRDAVPWKNQQPEAFPGNPGTVSSAPPTTFPGPEVFGKPGTGDRGPTTEGGLPSKVVTSSGSALRRCSCFADSGKDPAKLVSSQTWSLANAPEPPQFAGNRRNQSLCTPEASGTLGERSETPGVSGFAPRPLGDSGVRPERLPETRGIPGDSQTLGSCSETSWRLGCADYPERSPGDSGTPRDSQRLQISRRLSETRICGPPRKTPGDSGIS